MTKKKVSALITGTMMVMLMTTAISCKKTEVKPNSLKKNQEVLKSDEPKKSSIDDKTNSKLNKN